MPDKVYTALYPLDFSGYIFYQDIMSAIENYYYHGLHPGSFVYYMLANDFVEASYKADVWNKEYLDNYELWLVDRMPPAAWGSYEKVDDWLRSDRNAI